MKYKKKYDLGDEVKHYYVRDVVNYLKIMSNDSWINEIPKDFVVLLNDNFDMTKLSISYVPSLYFQLNRKFRKDRELIKETLKAYERHDKLNDVIIFSRVLRRKE